MKSIFSFIIFSFLLILGCSSAEDVIQSLEDKGLIQENTTTSNQVLSEISQVITNSYSDFSNQTSTLKENIETLCESSNLENLNQAQLSWRNAKLAFSRTEIISSGPVSRQEFIGHFNFWPTRTGDIETAIRNNEDFSLENFDNLSGRIRGLPALEYLLFGNNHDQNEVLENLNQKRCSFITAVATRLELDAQSVSTSWNENQEELTNDISELVNQMGAIVELIKDSKLSKPIGILSDNSINTSLLESEKSGYSQEAVVANLTGVQEIFNSGFSDYVSSRNPDLANELADLINQALEQASEITSPLYANLEEETTQTQMETTIDTLRDLRSLIAGQLSSELGVTIFFNDNDGD